MQRLVDLEMPVIAAVNGGAPVHPASSPATAFTSPARRPRYSGAREAFGAVRPIARPASPHASDRAQGGADRAPPSYLRSGRRRDLGQAPDEVEDFHHDPFPVVVESHFVR
jgi:hypothetical protein